jgi:hypothetical protein
VALVAPKTLDLTFDRINPTGQPIDAVLPNNQHKAPVWVLVVQD